MPKRITKNSPRSRHFLKEWRKHRGYNQTQLAEMIGTSVGNLSRIETLQQQYTQDFMDLACEALNIDMPSILMRNPLEPEAIWSIWDQAKQGEKVQITELARVVLKTGTK